MLKNSIAYFVYQKKREKFGLLNKILLGMAIISTLLVLPMYAEFYEHVTLTTYAYIFAAFFFFIYLTLVYGVWKWNGRTYKNIILMEAFKVVALYGEYQKGYYSDWIFGYVPLLIVEIALAYYLYKKIFPEYGWKGPKEDVDGTILFDSDLN
jgi:hypothetical protein